MANRSLTSRITSNPYIVGSFACIGGGLFGLDISSMSSMPNNPDFNRYFGYPSSDLLGGITASMPAGSFAGALLVGKLADWIGRRGTIIASGLIWSFGCVLQSAAQNVPMLVAGRVIAGLAVGLASTTVPLYQSEITAPHIRGRMVSLQQWSITWGILIQYFIQFGCSYVDGVGSFRIPWGLQLIPGLVLSAGMIVFPESPRWLMDHNREEEALQILSDVHGGGDKSAPLVQLEYNEIKQQIDFDRTQAARSYLDLVKPGVFRRVFLGMALQMWSQLTGMNVMMYYITLVFESAGITGRRGTLIASSVQYVLNMVFTIPTIIYIDKWGRRPLLLIGSSFMCFWLFLVGGLQKGFGDTYEVDNGNGGTEEKFLIRGHDSITKGVIVCSYFFVIIALTWGPVSWTYPSEIFDQRTRAKAVSLSTATNWAFNFALAYAVPPALENINAGTYMIFGGFCFAMTIHVFFMYPETKGRTLEEMEELWNSGHVFNAWKLKPHVGKKTLEEVVGHEKAVAIHEEDDRKV